MSNKGPGEPQGSQGQSLQADGLMNKAIHNQNTNTEKWGLQI